MCLTLIGLSLATLYALNAIRNMPREKSYIVFIDIEVFSMHWISFCLLASLWSQYLNIFKL